MISRRWRWKLIALPVVTGMWAVLAFWANIANPWIYLVLGTLIGLYAGIFAEFR